MAIIDYKDKYEKAVQAAMLAKQDTESAVTIGILENIFPELKESEDERIRKGIIRNLEYLMDRAEGFVKDELKERIAWLERKCKDNMGISEATKQKLEDNLNKALEKETPESWNKFLNEQCEQKMKTPEESLDIDSETYNKIVDECIYGEQKPAEWSEEDDIMAHDINYALRSQITYSVSRLQSMSTWIYNLKDRVQPKQEWKPSDEQMSVIEAVINNRSFQRRHLDSLYEQLKKLRGE